MCPYSPLSTELISFNQTFLCLFSLFLDLKQQHLSHNHSGAPVPLTPHPAGLHPSQLGGSAGLLALSGALGALPPHLAGKDSGDKKPHLSGPDSHPSGPEHLRGKQTQHPPPETPQSVIYRGINIYYLLSPVVKNKIIDSTFNPTSIFSVFRLFASSKKSDKNSMCLFRVFI